LATPRYAQVVVDLPLPHLDHVFDYRIEDNQIVQVQFGVRVRVPFRNRRANGFVVGLSVEPTVSGKISSIESVVSTEVVLTPEIFEICKHVAYRNVGNLFDVLRSAIPPRHARAEKKVFEPAISASSQKLESSSDLQQVLRRFLDHKEALLGVLNLPIPASPSDIVNGAINIDVAGAIFLFPDQHDVNRVIERIDSSYHSRIAVLTSQQSAEQRYLEFRRILTGIADLVIGTRSAIFAPIQKPQLIVIFDDGDDLLTSPIAPYWNARDAALVRMEQQNLKVLLCSRAESIESAHYLKQDMAIDLSMPTSRDTRISIVDEAGDDLHGRNSFTRMPSAVFAAIRHGLTQGTVLISVPRKGYQPLVACQSCREILRCQNCYGTFSIRGKGEIGSCQRCNALMTKPRCHACGSDKFRSLVIGVERTAEEIGKAFPGVPVKFIDAEHRENYSKSPDQILVAVPGTEPNFVFSTIIVLDSYLSLARPDGNSRIRFLRHLFNLKHQLSDSGTMIVVGDPTNSVLQCALRNDPVRVAADLLQERTETRLAPFARTAQILGDWAALEELKSILPPHAQIWGPTPTSKEMQTKHAAMSLVSMPKRESELLVRSIRSWVVNRSTNRRSAVTVKIDPDTL
jgi:primosomal protein N' (replication factor Y)